MSTASLAGLPAAAAALIAAAEVSTGVSPHVALGNGVGVKQVVVETWNNQPYAFMINTNDELYYGNLSSAAATVFPWNISTTFSGWTFVTGAAKEITVEMGQNNNPYIYLINSRDDLYYGNLSIASSGTVIPSTQAVFSGWTFLTGAAKDVAVGQWQGDSYIYLINTNDELYFGDLYTTTSNTIPPVTSPPQFSGWTFITGAAKQVSVDLWRNYPYLYLVNSNDELYYGNLYFAPNTPAQPVGHAALSGWTFITGAAKQVTISQWNGNPYLYLINSNDDLYYGYLSAASSNSGAAAIPPGPSKFSGWTFITGAAKQVAVSQWNGNPYLYLINSNDDLYYGYLNPAVSGNTPYTAFSGWTFLTGAAKQVATGTWQNKSYIYLINSNDDLYYSNLYFAAATTFPWNVYTGFRGWSPF